MTNEKNSEKKKRGTRASSTNGTESPAHVVTGVTKESYGKLASAFIGQNGGGFVVTVKNQRIDPLGDTSKVGFKKDGDDFLQTLKQWGAWLAYLRRKGCKTAFMERQGYYTVPAEWPHLFDAEATVQGDMAAGEEFERWQRREWLREKDRLGSLAQRQATILSHRFRLRNEQKVKETPPEHLEQAPEIDPPWLDGSSPELHELLKGEAA